MLIFDRVLCDLCHGPIGQLFNQPAQGPYLLADHTTSPNFAVCPDCYELSEVAA